MLYEFVIKRCKDFSALRITVGVTGIDASDCNASGKKFFEHPILAGSRQILAQQTGRVGHPRDRPIHVDFLWNNNECPVACDLKAGQ